MMKRLRLLTLAAACMAAPALVYADDDIAVDKLPKEVRAAIDERFPGAELLSAERDKDDGKVEYEVELRHKGQRYEVDVTEDGRIKDVDRED